MKESATFGFSSRSGRLGRKVPARHRLPAQNTRLLLRTTQWESLDTCLRRLRSGRRTATRKQLHEGMMRHAYTLWTTDTRFPGGQYVKDTYQARPDEIIRRELSLDFDTPAQCHARGTTVC